MLKGFSPSPKPRKKPELTKPIKQEPQPEQHDRAGGFEEEEHQHYEEDNDDDSVASSSRRRHPASPSSYHPESSCGGESEHSMSHAHSLATVLHEDGKLRRDRSKTDQKFLLSGGTF